MVAGLATASAGTASASAATTGALSCGTVYSIGNDSDGTTIYSLGALNTLGSLISAQPVVSVPASLDTAGNELAITDGGAAAYWANGGTAHIYKYDALTGAVTDLGKLAPTNLYMSVGGYDPANGIYYFDSSPNVGTYVMYGYNTTTNQFIGEVGTVSQSGLAGGDIAFDALGNMYWVGTNYSTGIAVLSVVQGGLPTTSSTASLTSKVVGSYATQASSEVNGIAFNSAGDLVMEDGLQGASTVSYIDAVDPESGAVITPWTHVTDNGEEVNGNDLASCATPPAIELQKNVVGRAKADDQFSLSISGDGGTPATATTSGTTTGVQSAAAGPYLGLSGTSYALSETATNNDLSSYISTYSCVNAADGNTPVTSGTGTSFTLTVPQPPADGNGLGIVCTFTNTPVNPALSIVKSQSAGPNPVTVAGQVLTYTFVVTNSGNQTLTNVKVNDTQSVSGEKLTSGPTCQSTTDSTGTCTTSGGNSVVSTLAPGSTATFTGTYTVTQADVDAGVVDDTAVSTGTPPGNETPPVSLPSTVVVPGTQSPALSIVKSQSAGPNPVTAAGQVLTYTFVVTNSGNQTLTDVLVKDTQSVAGEKLTSGPTCQSTTDSTGTCTTSGGNSVVSTLAPGSTATFTGTYTVTQADIDSGQVEDSAVSTGTPPPGETVPDSPPSTVVVPETQAPALTIVKSQSAGPNPVTKAGQVLTYKFVVTNSGNQTLSDVQVKDTQSVAGEKLASGPTCQSTTDPAGSCTTTSDGTSVVSTLAPGSTATFTATFAVTQADLEAGQVKDSAIATGTPPPGQPVPTSPPSTVVVPGTQTSALSIVKSQSAGPNPVTAAGQVLTFKFVVTNSGNQTLTNVQVNDAQSVSGEKLTSGPTCQSTTDSTGTCTTSGGNSVVSSLAPGSTATFTATYTVTQADVDAGQVEDAAVATGTPPPGETPPDSPPSTLVIPETQSPALTILKSQSAGPNPVTKAGQVLTYKFVVTNSGNQTLSNVLVKDTQSVAGEKLTSGPTCQSTTDPTGTCTTTSDGTSVVSSLAPGSTATFTATYTVTQADVDAGQVEDAAIATGTPPPGEPVPTSSPSTLVVPGTPSSALAILKSLVAGPNPATAAGQVLTYSFLVTNSGNGTLRNVSVTDTQSVSGEKLTGGPTCQSTTDPTGTCTTTSDGTSVVSSLAPGSTATFTGTYIVTQADVSAGVVQDSAISTGTPPGANTPVVSPPSPYRLAVVPPTIVAAITRASLKIVKSASLKQISRAGEKVVYYYEVTNTGGVTLNPVVVSDPMKGLSKVSCPGGSLAAGASELCTATRTTTKANLAEKSVDNTGTATGTAPDGSKVRAQSTVRIPVVRLMTRTYEVDTWGMNTTAVAAKAWNSLHSPRFREGDLMWTWLTAYGRQNFQDHWQVVTVTLPANSSSQAWVTAINKKVHAPGVGKVHTTAPLHGLHAGTITIAWSVPANGWLCYRPRQDVAAHEYFARS